MVKGDKGKGLLFIIAVTSVAIIADIAGKKRIETRSIDNDNSYLKERNKQEKHDETENTDVRVYDNFYIYVVKPALDKMLSFGGLVFLSPVFGAIAAAVWLDDPGTVFFTQKRIGKDKEYFVLHKFRTMKNHTPHDVPTHQLENPEQYITRTGRFLRKYSLDELPQIWDIFKGKMSIIGPRPALWNQADLIEERDKYGANSIRPGLTGWAQINGRDEVSISDKAVLDGEYTRRLKQGGFRAFLFDCRCFIGTVIAAVKHDGVVEGGTGMLPFS